MFPTDATLAAEPSDPTWTKERIINEVKEGLKYLPNREFIPFCRDSVKAALAFLQEPAIPKEPTEEMLYAMYKRMRVTQGFIVKSEMSDVMREALTNAYKALFDMLHNAQTMHDVWVVMTSRDGEENAKSFEFRDEKEAIAVRDRMIFDAVADGDPYRYVSPVFKAQVKL
jgi:hypothetical protein